jgi:hypothetical protein
MDTEIAVEDLTAAHRHNVEYVDAIKYDNNGAAIDCVRVWSKNSLPRFVAKDVEVPETNTLLVRVSSTDDADMEDLKVQISRLWHSRTPA